MTAAEYDALGAMYAADVEALLAADEARFEGLAPNVCLPVTADARVFVGRLLELTNLMNECYDRAELLRAA